MLGRFLSELVSMLRALTLGYVLYFLIGFASLFGALFGPRLGLPRIVVAMLFTILAVEGALLWFVIDLLRMRGRRLQ